MCLSAASSPGRFRGDIAGRAGGGLQQLLFRDKLGEFGALDSLFGRIEGFALASRGALADLHVLLERSRVEFARADGAGQQGLRLLRICAAIENNR